MKFLPTKLPKHDQDKVNMLMKKEQSQDLNPRKRTTGSCSIFCLNKTYKELNTKILCNTFMVIAYYSKLVIQN